MSLSLPCPQHRHVRPMVPEPFVSAVKDQADALREAEIVSIWPILLHCAAVFSHLSPFFQSTPGSPRQRRSGLSAPGRRSPLGKLLMLSVSLSTTTSDSIPCSSRIPCSSLFALDFLRPPRSLYPRVYKVSKARCLLQPSRSTRPKAATTLP